MGPNHHFALEEVGTKVVKVLQQGDVLCVVDNMTVSLTLTCHYKAVRFSSDSPLF